MPQNFQNPSYEIPGLDVGVALDWGVTILNSFVEFSRFTRGDAVGIISVFNAIIPLGVSVIDNEDGTLTLTSAVGTTEAVESFAFGWKGNQFYLFAFPPNFLLGALISGAKRVEDLEDGFGVDLNFITDVGATTTVIPIKDGTLVPNAYVGVPLEVNGLRRIVVSNTATAFTVSVALPIAPNANKAVRVQYGPTNDSGFLSSFTGLAGNDGFNETFNGGWPAGAPPTFQEAFDPALLLGSNLNNVFLNGSALPSGQFANDVRFRVFQVGPTGSPNGLVMSYRNRFGSLINSFPITFTVPLGTAIPPEGIDVPLQAFNFDGIQDLVAMSESSPPYSTYAMVANPGLDLERADF